MNRALLASIIFTLSAISVLAQTRTAGTSGQSRELIGAVANATTNRARNIDERSASGATTTRSASSTDRFANGQIIMTNVSLIDGHARFGSPPATDSIATRTRPRTTSGAAAGATAPVALTQIYRVGVGDVLDIQIVDLPSAKSTLYTVFAGGVLEYPLLDAPITVAGFT